MPELIVINLLLLNLQSGKWSEIFLLSVEGMTGKETKDCIGIKGAILRGVAYLLAGGVVGGIGEVDVRNICSDSLGSLCR